MLTRTAIVRTGPLYDQNQNVVELVSLGEVGGNAIVSGGVIFPPAIPNGTAPFPAGNNGSCLAANGWWIDASAFFINVGSVKCFVAVASALQSTGPGPYQGDYNVTFYNTDPGWPGNNYPTGFYFTAPFATESLLTPGDLPGLGVLAGAPGFV
jgi:hypothetical protein